MTVILGIDAAWTSHGSSGVAVIASDGDKFRFVAAEPSYSSFIEKASVAARTRTDGFPNVAALLKSAHILAGGEVDVVAVDMPMSKLEFSTRRPADQRISEVFGRCGAGTHSPSTERPGALGRYLSQRFHELGFPLATETVDRFPALIEVYPHPALLYLMNCSMRRTYKVGKSKKYWKDKAISERIGFLLEEWQSILAALSAEITAIDLKLPVSFSNLAPMKVYEDTLDAIISAWVGMKFFLGEAEAFGDENAAIWVPKNRAENINLRG